MRLLLGACSCVFHEFDAPDKVLYQMMRGLLCLRCAHVIHRVLASSRWHIGDAALPQDLKPGNVLVRAGGEAKGWIAARPGCEFRRRTFGHRNLMGIQAHHKRRWFHGRHRIMACGCCSVLKTSISLHWQPISKEANRTTTVFEHYGGDTHFAVGAKLILQDSQLTHCFRRLVFGSDDGHMRSQVKIGDLGMARGIDADEDINTFATSHNMLQEFHGVKLRQPFLKTASISAWKCWLDLAVWCLKDGHDEMMLTEYVVTRHYRAPEARGFPFF